MKAIKKFLVGMLAAVSVAALALPATSLAYYNDYNRSYGNSYDYVRTSYYAPVTRCDYYGCYTTYEKKYKTTKVARPYYRSTSSSTYNRGYNNGYYNGYDNGYYDGSRGYSYNNTSYRSYTNYSNNRYYNNYSNRYYTYDRGYYNNYYGNRYYSQPYYNSYYTSYYY